MLNKQVILVFCGVKLATACVHIKSDRVFEAGKKGHRHYLITDFRYSSAHWPSSSTGQTSHCAG